MKALPETLTAYWARKGTKPFSERDFILLTREFGFPIPPEVQDFLLRNSFKEQVKRHYWKPVLWSRSYCVISAGGAPLSVLKDYIQSQGGE